VQAEVRADDAQVRVALVPKQEIFEQIVVSAERGGDRIGPVSVAADTVEPAEVPVPPSTLMEVVERIPGVAENGQGGLFQVYSVRGVSGQRVQTLFAGVPIVGERRAGVSASFLDPLLMGGVEVVRGPSSTYYGSGALGGVVQVFPRRFEGTWGAAGWRSAGDERHLVAGWGDERWSVGIAHRAADDDEAADGTPLSSRFRQTSAALSRVWGRGERRLTLSVVPSYGEDIGKVNASFPEEVTLYPRERHLLTSLRLEGAEGWSLTIFGHPNDLVTRDLTPELTAEVVQEALDFGISGQGEWSLGADWTLQAGLDYLGRWGVTADETRVDGATGEVVDRFRTLDDARLDETGAFVSTRWGAGRATLSAGGRLTWQRQENGGGPAADDSAGNAFLGAVIPLGRSWEGTANAGTGLRFPSLSERFFAGTTGRGEVVGNPDLEPERSLNVDVGVRRYGGRTFVAVYVFRNEIDDYIERISLPDGRRTFVNLTSGTIEGVEVEAFWEARPGLRLAVTGHRMAGESAAGEALADVPADRAELSGAWTWGAWAVDGAWQRRVEKDDPGPGEQAIPAADLVSLAASYRIAPGWRLTVAGKNLLDETYFNAADDALPPMPGRSLELGIRWAP
jgi:iron complex outermembrane receptor protein